MAGILAMAMAASALAFNPVFAAGEIGISAEELLNRHLKDVPAGCEGLILQP